MMITATQYLRQAAHAERMGRDMLRRFTEEKEAEGFTVTAVKDSVVCSPTPARLAYDQLYPNFNLGGFALFRQGFEAASNP